MNGGDDDAAGVRPCRLEEPPGPDQRLEQRAARLLRWYPARWRERYGDEFGDVLASSMSDGKGGLRLSCNVVREGLLARLEEGGLIGCVAPPLRRARASAMAMLVGALAFVVSAVVLIRYAKGWQRTPALESLARAERAIRGSAAQRAYEITVSSPGYRQLRQAALRSPNGSSHAWKAFESAQTQATNILARSGAGRSFHEALMNLRNASGAPVAFNQVAMVALLVTFICLGSGLLVVSVAALRSLRRGNTKSLRLPLSLVVGSAALFVVGAMAYEADHKIPPGQPAREWTVLKWMVLNGNFRFWPVVVLPVCALGSIALAVIGGVQLMRRVEMGPRLCRVHGLLGTVAAGSLGIFLIAILAWVATLSLQAPDFLTASDQGIFGTPLLPLFVVAILFMSAAGWMVVSASARCRRNLWDV